MTDEIDRPQVPGYYWVRHRTPSGRVRTTVGHVYRMAHDDKARPDAVFLDGENFSVRDEIFLGWAGPIAEPSWDQPLVAEENLWGPGPADLHEIASMARRARLEISQATGDAGVAVVVAVALVGQPPYVFSGRNVSNTGKGPDAQVLSEMVQLSISKYVASFPKIDDEEPS